MGASIDPVKTILENTPKVKSSLFSSLDLYTLSKDNIYLVELDTEKFLPKDLCSIAKEFKASGLTGLFVAKNHLAISELSRDNLIAVKNIIDNLLEKTSDID